MNTLQILVFQVLLFLCNPLIAQNLSYVLDISRTLSSKQFAGRGYSTYPYAPDAGIEKARRFIIQEIKKNGAYDLYKYIQKSRHFKKKTNFNKLKFSNKYTADKIYFTYNNILVSSLTIFSKTEDKKLVLGKDYLPDASTPSIEFSGTLIQQDSIHFVNKTNRIIFQVENKLIHSVSTTQDDYVLIHLHKNVLSDITNNKIECQLKIKSQIQNVKTENIYCFIPGTIYPDSFIVFSAHYDHLGNIDTTYFPGANDNASGVAVLLDLMQYYKQHPSKYSIAFFFFTGEEIGLIGSKHYVTHPLFDLNRIKFLINLDLVGGGSEGIMVVNGKIFPEELERMEKINQQNQYNITIKARGKAQNSDHYWFSENNVKCFFIYTLGDITAYHNIDDTPNNLKFTNYNNFFNLLIHFVASY